MLKLILKTSLVFCLTSVSSSRSFSTLLVRNYSTSQSTSKILNSLKPLKIYSSLHHPAKKAKMLNDLTGQGGVVLFLSKNSSLYAIEGSDNLANYLTMLFKKDYLNYLASLRGSSTTKKSRPQIKSHYQELLKEGWKDYDLYLLEVWDTKKTSTAEERLAHYHTKYLPKLNLVRYAYSANGEIEAVYQWNNFKTKEQLLAKSQARAETKPLLTYRIDNKSPLDKLKAKVWHENKHKTGVYRWVNRINRQFYIGCSLNLGNILYSLQLDKITFNGKDYLLNQAFQEHGLTNFNLQILAYCSPEELAEKEAYYLNLYHPEYNLPKDNKEDESIIDNSLSKSPTSIIEYNAFAKQLVLFQPTNKQITSINTPAFSLTPLEVKPSSLLIIQEPIEEPIREVKTKKWTLSEATRQKQSLAQQKRTKHPKFGLAVQVLDLTNNTTVVYSSLREAARALNIRVERISEYFNREQSKPYKKRYVFTKV